MSGRREAVRRGALIALLGLALFATSGLVQYLVWSPGQSIALGWPLNYFAIGWAGRGPHLWSLASLCLDLMLWLVAAAAAIWLMGRRPSAGAGG